jgi:hypothetical protein
MLGAIITVSTALVFKDKKEKWSGIFKTISNTKPAVVPCGKEIRQFLIKNDFRTIGNEFRNASQNPLLAKSPGVTYAY